VSVSTIGKLETGSRQPSRRLIAAICRALDLPSPLLGAALRFSLEPTEHGAAIQTLREALREYIAARTDPNAFAARHSPDGTDGTERLLALSEAIDRADLAARLLAQLSNPRKDPR
jgi:transcriptional regulator with XRE-family HTH domain